MNSPNIDDFRKHSFDFLIVGGGTAGLVLAARLSENSNVRVGLVEAGLSRLEDPLVNMPGGVQMMLHNPEYDWNYHTAPQSGVYNRVYHAARGKMLGGSSGINFMAYGRPSAQEIDDWGTKLGNKGWSWANLLQYFLRTERLEVDQPNIQKRNPEDCPLEESLHGLDGPIHTSFSTWQFPFEKELLTALRDVSGLPSPPEPYSGSRSGFYRSLFAVNRTDLPVRSYAGNGYLAPIMGRSNLQILTNTQVSKVTLEKQQSGEVVAKGIEIQDEGTYYTANAAKEVILCAGSFNSPQLLELSGIGDPAILEKHGVACLVPNTDVGNNLQDHPMTGVIYELASGYTSLDSMFLDPTLVQEYQKLYTESHTGPFSSATSLTGFLPLSSQVSKVELEKTIASITSLDQSGAESSLSPPQNTDFLKKQYEALVLRMQSPQSPDIQFVGAPATFDLAEGHGNAEKITHGPPPGHNACYTLSVNTMQPCSRGSVHIQSSNPSDPPLIDLGLLTHPADVDVLAAGLDFADRVFQSPLLRDKVARRVEPPPEVDLRDRDAAREVVRGRILSYHHAAGTCAMGQVVDERLRVKGVSGLRVVDASVFPTQISVAPMATVYAVAEKAADMIKEDYQLL
ncbi:alcohol oxidase [Thozetella sp. PMI_491]|nr:alcohol oxidase [Thozetella sp. PMI_491]